ncbi:MAG TPA: Ger(x)C family spore germination protein [Firmicutes bacterium]|nr:Ger(x)C family spore germination protein [Bacillota bacterium]
MRTWFLLVAVLLGFAMIPSCREKSQINNRVVVTAVGIDDAGQEGCALSIQALEALKIAGSLTNQEGNATGLYQTQGESVASAMKSFVTQTGRNTYLLQNRAIILSLDQAKKQPLQSTLDYFLRNTESRPGVYLAISRGSPDEVLGIQTSSYTIPSEYLATLLREGQRWGYSAGTTMLDAERAISGMFDAYLPIVRVEGEGEDAAIQMDGTAVFRQGVFAGELDAKETRGLLFIENALERSAFTIRQDGGSTTTLELQSSHTKVSVDRAGDTAAFTIRVTAKAEIAEEADGDRLKDSQLAQINDRLAQTIEEEVRAAVEKTVMEYGCDVFGFGRRVMQKEPGLIRGREDEWPEKLKECAYHIEVETSIRSIGTDTGADPNPVS